MEMDPPRMQSTSNPKSALQWDNGLWMSILCGKKSKWRVSTTMSTSRHCDPLLHHQLFVT
ncbi:hypothetical protein Sjap_008470 [Stephania japonica]|uniref:Uncharacterized protein n=1 Tax=Stephania japonica TaxID=461633 RepID=A0AAP0PBD5_9MAGN